MALRSALVCLVLLVLGVPGLASETGLSGDEGHPRARFPLTVWAPTLGTGGLDAAVRRAVDDWNAVAREALGVEVFTWAPGREQAQVALSVGPAPSPKLMGETHVRSDDAGIILFPVSIAVFELPARGQTSPETLFYQIVAHELGHALGLVHTRDPRSLMCCVPGSVDFSDPAVRDAYVEARRHPDVRSVRGELAEHYARFWRPRH